MSDNVIAVEDKVIVEEIIKKAEEKKTDSGLYIPDSDDHSGIQQEPQVFGKVISVGEKVPKSIAIGDIIVAARHGGQAFMWDKKIYKTYMLGEIYGVLKEGK